MGYGDCKIGNVTISRVYFVEGLGHNLFSVGQFCDSDLEVAFLQHTCFIHNLDGVDLLIGSRGNNIYTLSLKDMMAQGLVRGLPKLKFKKDHLYSACAMGKSKKKSHKPKSEDTNQEKLYLLHMAVAVVPSFSHGSLQQVWSSILADRSDKGFFVRVDQERFVKSTDIFSQSIAYAIMGYEAKEHYNQFTYDAILERDFLSNKVCFDHYNTTAVLEPDALTAVQLRVLKLEKDVSKLKKIDHFVEALATFKSQPSKIKTSTIDLEPKCEKRALKIRKIKKEQAEKQKMPKYRIKSTDKMTLKEYDLKSTLYQTKNENKSFNRNHDNHALYHALMEALIEDENAMDKGVADTVKNHKRQYDDDEDDDEDPSAEPNQDNHTQEVLLGPVYNLLKGTCTSSIELEYNMEECFKALIDRIDWNNPEGDRCPFNLTKPLPLKGRLGRLTVAAEYFFNDLEILKSSDPLRRKLYTPSYKPPGVIYEDLNNKKRVMWANGLYKISDRTLKIVRDELHHRILDFRLGYNKEMSKRKWTAIDKRISELMVELVDK
nr:hypothetical protein [Tanacetum cinerariifolium]